MYPQSTLPIPIEEVFDRLAEIATSIQNAEDLDQVLDITTREVRAILQSDRVLIYQFLSNQTSVVIAESVGATWTSLHGQLVDDSCWENSWIEKFYQGTLREISDIRDSDLSVDYQDFLSRLQVKAALVVPILIRQPNPELGTSTSSNLWGLLIIHQCHHPRTWTALDRKILKQVAITLSLDLQQRNLPPPLSPKVTQSWRDRNDMLRKLSEQIPGVIYQYRLYPDGSSCFPYASEAIRQIYEVSPEQVQEDANEILQLLHPEDVQSVLDSIQKSAETLQLWHHEYRVILPKQGIRWLEGHAMPEALSDRSILWHGYIRDVTDRKQLEISLKRSEALFRGIFEQAKVGINISSAASGQFIQVNQCFCDLVGYTEAELKQMTFLDVTHPDDQSLSLDYLSKLITGEVSIYSIDKRYCCKDGQIQWANLTVSHIFDEQGELLYTVGMAIDISSRKSAEYALQQQTERERMIHEIAKRIRQSLHLNDILNTTVSEVRHFLQTDRVIIYRFNPDWSGVVVTESLETGWQSILNWQITDTFFVETQGKTYQPGTVQAVSDILTGGLAPCHIELLEMLQVRAKLVVPILQGEHLWGLLVAQHCRSPRDWQPLEIELLSQLATQVAIAIQQSELHHQLQALNTHLESQVQQRTAQLQQALEIEAALKRITDKVRDSLDEGQILQTVVKELTETLKVNCCDAAIYNAEHTESTIQYEFTNGAPTSKGLVCKISESSDPRIYHQLFQGKYTQFCLTEKNYLRPEQPRQVILACPILDDQGVLGDLWLFKGPDSYFDEMEIRLVQQVANQCAIALRQSRLYRASQEQVRELERLNQLKDDFLSTVSHELRTPMSSIKMATQMLEIGLKSAHVFETNPETNRYFQILKTECKREIDLINNLLDLTQIDSDQNPLHWSPIYLQFWLSHITEPFMERTRQQQQILEIIVPDTLPAVTTDLSHLGRILTELLNNACKYTPPHETITISANLIESEMSAVASPAIAISITNSGVEIPASEYEQIFERFYRIPNSDPWKYDGTGLGLALVKKLVTQIGGAIAVTSSNNSTQFIVHLPLDPSVASS